MSQSIEAFDPTPEQQELIDRLGQTMFEETGCVLTSAELLMAAAAQILFAAYAPQAALNLLETITDGARQAVREIMN